MSADALPATRTPAAATAVDAGLYLIVVLSGIAGLGYQMAWSRMLAVSLGHEIVAVLAVVAAFFTGLALGAFVLNDIVRRSARPQLWYAALEFLIGGWALLLVLLIPHYNQWMPQLVGAEPGAVRQWALAFGGTLLLLLPATAAMGATLPAVERVCAGLRQRSDRVAGLYACNTFGAVLGTLLATFALVPALGLATTMMLFAAVNILCGVAVILAFANAAAALPAAPVPVAQPPLAGGGHRRLLWCLFISGFLGLGYEVLVVRVVSQVLENTAYTFAAVLSIYLLGSALGAGCYQRCWAGRHLDGGRWSQLLSRLVAATALTCLLGIAALWLSDSVYRAVLGLLGPGTGAAVVAELSVAATVFFLPTLCMGALFSHLAQRAMRSTGLGVALGVNTLGAALAPLCFGVLLLPAVGAKVALALVAAAYLLLLPPAPPRVWLPALAPAAAALALVIAPLQLRFIATPAGSELLAYEDGVMAAVAVIADGSGHRHLKVNNHFTMGGTASRFSDHRQSHIPLLLHGAPESALYLGLGTGITFNAARYYPQLRATGVELIPEMLPLLGYFDAGPGAGTWPIPPRLLSADARRFIVSSDAQYDVIIAEIFHPSRDGAGSLYTQEHFSVIKSRLAPGGLFCQWLPLFQLDLHTLRTIVRTFLQVFPGAQMHLGHFSLQQPILCLVGSREPRTYQSNWLLNRVRDPALQQQLVQMRLNSDFALFGGFLGGGEALADFAGSGPLNTDDWPLVTFSAPDFVYADPEPAAVRLLQLVDALDDRRGTLLAGLAGERDFSRRLHDYWRARDTFLRAGVDVRPGEDIRRLVAQTREPLLAALRLSSDFTPAYRSLIGMAQALHQVDRRAAYELLTDLDAASPGDDFARRLRRQLYGN